MIIFLIAIVFTLLVLLFQKTRSKSCNISEFLKNRNQKGSCPENGTLKASSDCKVPCDSPEDDGEIKVSCSSNGKTVTESTCKFPITSSGEFSPGEFSPGDLQFFNSSPNLPTIQTQSSLIRIFKVLNNTLCTDDCVDLHSAIPQDAGGNAIAFLPGHKIFGDGSWADYIFTLRTAIRKSGLSAADIGSRVAYNPETLKKCKNSAGVEESVNNLVTVIMNSPTLPLEPVIAIVTQLACACKFTENIPDWCNN